jgi:hypothetical protein
LHIVGGGIKMDKLLEIDDYDANSHLSTYEIGFPHPLVYSRYFYGHYGDLVIQGESQTYTSNIQFVTGSTVVGDDPPTQRLIITGDGSVGIGDFWEGGLSSPPKSKLQIKNGDVYLETIGTGVILKSPNGSCWRMTVDDAGQMQTTSITCPN